MNVVVVGAGPAGLMAAEVLATAGLSVSVYDQRRSPARKFVLAGRGGLNITHSEPLELFLDRYGSDRQFLEPAIRAFSPNDLRAWSTVLGEETFVGSSGRVFPASFRAVPLLRSWLRRLDSLGVELHLGRTWDGWESENSFRFTAPAVTKQGVRTVDVVPFDAAVLALGGASWPSVSSDGSWQSILRERQIHVEPLRPANSGVAVSWSPVMIERFAGMPVKNAAVLVREVDDTGDVGEISGSESGSRSTATETHIVRGDPVITASGIEGGPIYAQSRLIRNNLAAGHARIALDLFPDLTEAALFERLRSRRESGSRGESSARWLRRCGFSPVAAGLLREVTQNTLPTEPAEIAALAKEVPIRVDAMSSIDRAISTAGGVAWSEVDESFQLHRAPNVYAVGEMLDWEAPTGGYLLQACFSTAHHAASAVHWAL